jgi:hypothetical protein
MEPMCCLEKAANKANALPDMAAQLALHVVQAAHADKAVLTGMQTLSKPCAAFDPLMMVVHGNRALRCSLKRAVVLRLVRTQAQHCRSAVAQGALSCYSSDVLAVSRRAYAYLLASVLGVTPTKAHPRCGHRVYVWRLCVGRRLAGCAGS